MMPDARRLFVARPLEACCCIVLLVAAVADAEGVTPDDYRLWGQEALATIQRDFAIPGSRLLAEEVSREPASARPAFAWPAGVQLSALAAGARFSADSRASLVRYLEALDAHWIVHHKIGGYNSVASASASADRYYDDNAWLVLGLIEAYEATGDRRLLDRAQQAFNFVMSGEDEQLGGGLYWRENRRATKNTCANAPAIVCGLRLHRYTGDARHRVAAERLYAWVRRHLKDDRSGLYNDHIRLDGKVDGRLYTYNTGLMIRANCLLHEATGRDDYRREARRLAEAAARQWIDGDTRTLRGGAKFAHLLMEGLLELERIAPSGRWSRVAQATTASVRDARDPSTGRYPARWSPIPPWEPSAALIDQASAARAFFVLAIASDRETPRPTDRQPPAGDRPVEADAGQVD